MTLYSALAAVDPSACQETPADPYRVAHIGAAAKPLPRTEEAARRADALARSLCSARERLAAPLACIAASLVRERAWCALGFARASDFTRELLGRTGRWLRDLAALHEALSTLDGLAAALAGDDGGAPLGRRRALLIAQVANTSTLFTWIARARTLTVRELQAAVAQARHAAETAALGDDVAPGPPAAASLPFDETAPPAADTATSSDDGAADCTLLSLAAPRAVVAAFDEAIDLYRAVEGSETTVTSFVEALIGEFAAGGLDPESDPTSETHRRRAGSNLSRKLIEKSLARSTNRWRQLPRSAEASWGLALGRSTLTRLAAITREADAGTPSERVARMKELLAIENDIEIHLGRLLVSMGERDVWNRLRFAGMGHYAEERLGLSRTAAQGRARAARLLGRFPLLRAAYERDTVGLEATLLVGRILSAADATGAVPVATAGADSVAPDAADAATTGPDARLERAWVRHAAEVTFKRIRDEARALDRSRAFAVHPDLHPQDQSAPLRDAEWHQSLRREPGAARRRVAALGLIALGVRPVPPEVGVQPPAFCPATSLIPEPDVFLRLTLPDHLAGYFLAVVEATRRGLANQVEAIPWDEPWPDPEDSAALAATPALLAARTFSIRCRRIPAWVGLLALIEDFVTTWDPDEGEHDGAKCGQLDHVSDNPILVRDGWRCAAPACSSHRNLEVHHVIYRSRGGGDEDWNLVTLCRFHHQRGEHGGLARCVGRAPVGLTWRLGASASEVGIFWYRNERRIDSRHPDVSDGQTQAGRHRIGWENEVGGPEPWTRPPARVLRSR